MKRLFLVIALAMGLASATAAPAGPPAFDKAEGAGSYVISAFGIHVDFSLSALQRGFGTRATGFYRQSFPGIRGDVTCLSVLGNHALIAGVLTDVAPGSELPWAPGDPFLVTMIDNGPPGSSPRDTISSVFVFSSGQAFTLPVPPGFPSVCPPPSVWPGGAPLEDGNIVVEDESPGIGLAP